MKLPTSSFFYTSDSQGALKFDHRYERDIFILRRIDRLVIPVSQLILKTINSIYFFIFKSLGRFSPIDKSFFKDRISEKEIVKLKESIPNLLLINTAIIVVLPGLIGALATLSIGTLLSISTLNITLIGSLVSLQLIILETRYLLSIIEIVPTLSLSKAVGSKDVSNNNIDVVSVIGTYVGSSATLVSHNPAFSEKKRSLINYLSQFGNISHLKLEAYNADSNINKGLELITDFILKEYSSSTIPYQEWIDEIEKHKNIFIYKIRQENHSQPLSIINNLFKNANITEIGERIKLLEPITIIINISLKIISLFKETTLCSDIVDFFVDHPH